MNTSPTRDVLRFHWIGGVPEVTGRTSTSVKAWLTEGNFVFSSCDPKTGSTEFYTGAWKEFTRALAHDVGRMASSSFESAYGITGSNEIQRSTAWPLIRAYYSAFFAAHSVARMFGKFVTQLETEQVEVLNRAAVVSGSPTALSAGLYKLTVHPEANVFRFEKLLNGSHEDTWRVFADLLDHLLEASLKNTPYADTASIQETAVFLDGLTSVMRTSPCGKRANWLSHLRNEINYQHRHGAWHPHENSKKFRTDIESNFSKWRASTGATFSGDKHQLGKYSAACASIIALCRELVEEMIIRNSEKNSFLKYGAAQVLKQAK